MDQAAILDLGGHIAHRVSGSHLGSGSVAVPTEPAHFKRARHYSEKQEHHIAQLRSTLQRDILSLFRLGESHRPNALIYGDVERLCIMKHSEQAVLAEKIYSGIDNKISMLDETLRTAYSNIEHSAASAATEVVNTCKDWMELLFLASKLFLYLDRSYLLHHPRKQGILEYGMTRFTARVFVQADSEDVLEKQDDPLRRLVSLLLRERDGEKRSASALKLLLTTLGEIDPGRRLNVFALLESLIVENYRTYQKRWLKHKEAYVCEFYNQLMADFQMFKDAGQPAVFLQNLLKKLKWDFLVSDLTLYVEPGLPVLCERPCYPFLREVKLACDSTMADYGVDSNKILLAMWGKHTRALAEKITPDMEVVPEILRLWQDTSHVCKTVLEDEAFEYEARSAITRALGRKEVAGGFLVSISKYCDWALKQDDVDPDARVLGDEMRSVFNLLPDKQTFVSVYEKDLSKRMLMSKNFCYEAEKNVVDVLVSFVGESEGDENFKLRAMLRDYAKSKESFSQIRLPCAPSMDFSALVLEKKVWPEIPGFGPDIRMPPPLSQALANFEKEFAGKDKKNKVLDWNSYTLHQITLATAFDTGVKELQVNLSQAIVLMLFEETDEMTIPQILAATLMGEKLLKRVLSSLSTEKYPVLRIGGSRVTLNRNFTDKAHKVKLPMGREKDTTSVETVKKLVQQDRTSETRAVLVRLLKTHRSLSFTELLGMTIAEMTPRGPPEIQEIKTEIEYLIVSDYISRDDKGTTMSYVP